MLNGINLACARSLEHAQVVARNLFGILVAFPRVVDLQTGPFIRVHCLNDRSLELAVGCRLWCEQRRIGSTDSQFSISTRFGVSVGTDGSGPDLVLSRIEFWVHRVAPRPAHRR